MNFIDRVLEEVLAILIAVVILIGALAYFGSTPTQRYACDLKTTTIIQDAVCILKTAY